MPPGQLTPRQRELREAILGGPRGHEPTTFKFVDEEGVLLGPFCTFLLSPDLGMHLQELGAAIRFNSALPARARELAILYTANHHHSPFEWYAHAAVGRSVGVTESELEAIKLGNPLKLQNDLERVTVQLTTELLQTGDASDQTYAGAKETLGEALTFDVCTLVGYYSLLALQMRVFRTDVIPK